MKKILLGILICSLFVTGCGADEKQENITEGNVENMSFKETTEVTNHVKIVMEDGGIILVELLPEYAPITVENFQKLVSENFYDGIIFHRIVEDFVIQGGDPTGTGMGGSEENITGEFSENGIDNTLSHDRGVLSMARSYEMDSASSQFFICLLSETCKQLDGSYAGFGRVIAGMDVVDSIAAVTVDANDKPLTEQKMLTVRFVEIEEN